MVLGVGWIVVGAALALIHRRHATKLDSTIALYIGMMMVGVAFVLDDLGSTAIATLLFVLAVTFPLWMVVREIRTSLRRRARRPGLGSPGRGRAEPRLPLVVWRHQGGN